MNYIIKRFRQDPNLAAPDTRDWARQIGLDYFDSELNGDEVHSLAIKLLDNRRVTRLDLLTSYLGERDISSALRNIKESHIEIVSLDLLDHWLDEEWGISKKIKDNQSDPIISMASLDEDRAKDLIECCAMETALYDYLMKTHVWTSQKRGIRVSLLKKSPSTNAESVISASAEEMVSMLYRAVVNREPDPEGLRNHVDAIAKGTPLEAIIRGMLRSKEFSAKFLETVAANPK